MKSCSGALAAYIAQGQTTLATLLKVTRQYDGAVYGFTEHDQNIVFSGLTYISTTSYNRFNLNAKQSTDATTTELSGAFDSIITRADVLAELWDNAQLTLYLVNWQDLTAGAMILDTGSFGQFEPQEFGFKVQLHGMSYLLTFLGGDLCAPECRVDFGSPLCAPGGSLFSGTTINSLLQTLTVLTTDGVKTMTVSGLTNTGKPFNGGLVTFKTGNNTNLSGEVLSVNFGTNTIVLRPTVLINTIQVGDTLYLFPACDKQFQTCVATWGNGENFQGEPHAPGPDNILQFPDYVPPR